MDRQIGTNCQQEYEVRENSHNNGIYMIVN